MSALYAYFRPTFYTYYGKAGEKAPKTVEHVIIDPSLIHIGERAFQGCKSLESIEIPKSVKTIGEYAFQGCTSLKSIEIPEGVTSIGKRAFDGCTSLSDDFFLREEVSLSLSSTIRKEVWQEPPLPPFAKTFRKEVSREPKFSSTFRKEFSREPSWWWSNYKQWSYAIWSLLFIVIGCWSRLGGWLLRATLPKLGWLIRATLPKWAKCFIRRKGLQALITGRSPSTDFLVAGPASFALDWIVTDTFSLEWEVGHDTAWDDRMVQRFALASLYYSLDIASEHWWIHPEALGNGSWLNKTKHECGWNMNEIKCGVQEVVGLDLAGSSLSGPLPIELGLLSQLTSLDLHANKMTGSIPVELGRLTNLSKLNLQDNKLTGSIPPSLCGSSPVPTILIDCDISCNCCVMPCTYGWIIGPVRLWLGLYI
jgi:hypothetical protein